MNLPGPAALLADFASAFSQTSRLLQLHLGTSSGLSPEQLLPLKLVGHHSINQGYSFELSCVSADAFIPLKQLIAQPIAVSLLCDDGTYRPLTGWVGAAQQLGADGGFARYLLNIEDSLSLLERRVNNRVFQRLSAKDVCLTLVREHLKSNSILSASLEIDDRCTRDYPVQSWITQYNESDARFIRRLLAQEGINHVFAHRLNQEHILTTLILFDDNAQLDEIGEVRFHRTDGTEESDTVTQWQASRTLAPGNIAAASYDYKPVSVARLTEVSRLDQGEAGLALSATLEDYRFDVSHYGNDAQDYQRYAELRMLAHEHAAKFFVGEGSVRAFQAGQLFTLIQHPELDAHPEIDRRFVLTRVELHAVNNLPGLNKESELENATCGLVYTNTFTAHRQTVKLVPPYRDTEYAKPSAPQLLSATVVGPAGEEIYTDALGRIRVNLHFPRSQDHAQGGASQNETDSVWLRVSQAWTGTEYGALFIPRVGDEVLISFIGGDIDRPIVTGTVYNGSHHPATFSHTGKLPGNKALSGIKSKMVKGAGANELLLDDSTNEQRVRLATDHGKTELNQGYLVHPRSEGKGTPRGEGFELRSDMAGAIRAGQGLLLSTDARQKAQGKQLDRQELLGQLETALALAKQLAELSTTHHAEDTDTQAQNQLLEHIQHWEQGSNTDKEGDKSQGGKPVIAISGQAGIALSTPQAMTVHTGTNLDIVTSQDTSITTGRNFKARAANLISLFSHKLGMKLIAASGKIDIQAQSDNIEVTSAKKFNLTALEEIILQAPKITIIAQGAGMDLGTGKIISKTQGSHTEHAAKHSQVGPAGVGLILPAMPTSTLTPTDLALTYRYHDEEPVQGAKVLVKLADSSEREGVTNSAGEVVFKNIPPGPVQIKYQPDARSRNRIDKTPNDATSDSLDDILQRRMPPTKSSS